MEKKYKFSTTQVDLSEETTSKFLETGKDLISQKDLFGDGFETSPHVTILYGIHESYPIPPLVDIIETFPRFTVVLGDVSLFDNDEKFDVVKTEVESSDLYILRSEFINNCHYTLTHPEYIPHATIAFVKKGTCDHLVGNPSFRGLAFPVNYITFCGTDGTQRKIKLGTR